MEEFEESYKAGETVEIYDEGNTVIQHPVGNRGGKIQEPLFMKHFKEKGID